MNEKVFLNFKWQFWNDVNSSRGALLGEVKDSLHLPFVWAYISTLALLSPMELANLLFFYQLMPNNRRPSNLSRVLVTPNSSTTPIAACIFTGAGVPSEEAKLPHPVHVFLSQY